MESGMAYAEACVQKVWTRFFFHFGSSRERR